MQRIGKTTATFFQAKGWHIALNGQPSKREQIYTRNVRPL